MAARGDRWAKRGRLLTVVAWLGLPVATAATLGDALGPVSAPVRAVAVVGLYGAWAGGLLALLVPRSVGLTAVRILGPVALAAVGWAVFAGDRPDAADAVGLGWAAAVAATTLAGVTADALVDGSSYGDERRFALRTPSVVLFGPAQATWLAVVAGVAAGPLLLAAGRWVVGGLATLVGGGAAVLGVRALHQLSRRWVVFVPAGVVLHDPLATAEPVLFPRRLVAGLAPAAIDIAAETVVDLSGGAPGVVLEVALRQPIDIPLRVRRRSALGSPPAERVRFTPIRAGAVLTEAAARRLDGGRDGSA